VNAKKDTPPQAVERGRAGKRARGQRFPGPRPPRNELYLRLSLVLFLFMSFLTCLEEGIASSCFRLRGY